MENTFVQAVRVLFHSPDAAKRKEADTWLQSCRADVACWRLVESLLNQPGELEAEVCYLAAQSLRAKVQFDFEQLPAESAIPLRDQLLRYCVTYRHTHIRTQLSLAVADMAIHTEWDAVDGLLEKFGDSEETLCVVVEILQFLPEENMNNNLHAQGERRYRSREKLRDATPKVLLFLDHVRNTASRKQILLCFLAWLQFGEFSCEQLATYNLLLECFTTILDADTGEAAADVIVEVIRMSGQEMRVFQPLVCKILDFLEKLEDAFTKFVGENDDIAQSLVRVYTEAGECLVDTIATKHGDRQVMCLLRVLLRSVELAPAFSWIAWGFWGQLADALLHSASTENDNLGAFRPIFRELLAAATRAVQHATADVLADDDEDGPRGWHLHAVVAEGIARVLCPADTAEMLVQSCVACEDTLGREARLHLLSVVASRNAVPQSAAIREAILWVAQVIRQNNSDPAWHVLRLTALRACGSMSEWIVGDEECSRQHLDALTHLFVHSDHGSPQMREQGAKSFRQLCYSGRKRWVPYVPQLFNVVKATFGCMVPTRVHLLIVSGVALLCAQVSADGDYEKCFGELLLLFLQQLPHERQGDVVAQILARLLVVMEIGVPRLRNESSGKGKIVGQIVSDRLWPVITHVMQESRESSVVENGTHLLEQCVHCVPEHCKRMVPQLIVLLDEGFRAHGHQSYLYCLESLEKSYEDTEIKDAIRVVSQRLANGSHQQ